MLIGDYFAEISRLVHDYEAAGFIQSSDILTEARSDDLGYLRATFIFLDHSALYVREFVRVHRDQIEPLTFAYHYQGRSGDLRFRYDDATHRPRTPSPVHKHLPDRIVSAEGLTLRDVFREIVREHLKR